MKSQSEVFDWHGGCWMGNRGSSHCQAVQATVEKLEFQLVVATWHSKRIWRCATTATNKKLILEQCNSWRRIHGERTSTTDRGDVFINRQGAVYYKPINYFYFCSRIKDMPLKIFYTSAQIWAEVWTSWGERILRLLLDSSYKFLFRTSWSY
jgi:hypothetical protein